MHLVKGNRHNVRIHYPHAASDLGQFIPATVHTTVEVNRHGKLVCLRGNEDHPDVDAPMFEGTVFDPVTFRQVSNLHKKGARKIHGWFLASLTIED